MFHAEHVEHNMNDDTGERTKTMHNTTNANGEQTEIVIENENAEAEVEGVEGTSTETTLNDAVKAARGTSEEHSELSTVKEESGHMVGEEHHARCVHSDEEASSIVLHVSRDMNKGKKGEEACETAAAKETEEISKESVRVKCITKKKNEKSETIKSRKRDCHISFENSKNYTTTMSKTNLNKESEKMNMKAADVHDNDTNEMTRIPEITTEELRAAVNKLKKGKSSDSDGIRAEDIKACDDETREMVRQIFIEIMKKNEFTSEAWKKVKIKVI